MSELDQGYLMALGQNHSHRSQRLTLLLAKHYLEAVYQQENKHWGFWQIHHAKFRDHKSDYIIFLQINKLQILSNP